MNAFLQRRGALVALLVLLVAGGAGVVHLGHDDGAHPVIPRYALAAGAGAVPESLELAAAPSSTFELLLRPSGPVPTKVVAYVFAIGEGEPNPVDAKVALSTDGEVRITGQSRALTGAREARVVVGATTEFKRFEDALSRARAGTSDDHVRVVAIPIVRLR